MSKFSAVKFDLAEITQKLADASSRDEIITVLDILTKNGLDELARQEGITFPRAVSKRKGLTWPLSSLRSCLIATRELITEKSSRCPYLQEFLQSWRSAITKTEKLIS